MISTYFRPDNLIILHYCMLLWSKFRILSYNNTSYTPLHCLNWHSQSKIFIMFLFTRLFHLCITQHQPGSSDYNTILLSLNCYLFKNDTKLFLKIVLNSFTNSLIKFLFKNCLASLHEKASMFCCYIIIIVIFKTKEHQFLRNLLTAV